MMAKVHEADDIIACTKQLRCRRRHLQRSRVSEQSMRPVLCRDEWKSQDHRQDRRRMPQVSCPELLQEWTTVHRRRPMRCRR